MPKGIYKRTKPVWNKGKILGSNPEHSKRMKGRTPWNKGLKTGIKPWLGKKRPDLLDTGATKTMFKREHKPWNKGKKGVLDGYWTGKKRPDIAGEKCHLWKGGIYPEIMRIRKSPEYKNWRGLVFKRDNWSCINCGQRGGILHAHHLKKFSYYKKLRFTLENGVTLCKECHKIANYVFAKKYQYTPELWRERISERSCPGNMD